MALTQFKSTSFKPSAIWGRLPVPCLFLLFLLIWCSPAQAQFSGISPREDATVRAIEVRGNDRIDQGTILYYIRTKVGEALRAPVVRRDIEQIYSLGQFKDIRVETEPFEDGVRVIYMVEEIPSIGEVRFSGNNQVENRDLREAIALKRGATFKEHLIQDTKEKIKAVYHEKGYFFVEMDIQTRAPRPGIVDVSVNIKEGEKVSIEEIRLKVNKNIES